MNETACDTANSTHALIRAGGPHPSMRGAPDLFARFIGDWEFDIDQYENGNTRHGRGSWHFDWVLDGRAIQDVWIVEPDAGVDDGEFGTSLRYPDPEAGVWRVAWMGPVRKTRNLLTARGTAEGITLETTNLRGTPERWMFSDITPDSFVWRALVARDIGEWVMRTEMRVRRRAP